MKRPMMLYIISVIVLCAGCGHEGSKLTLLAAQKSANMDGLEGLIVEVHQGDRSWEFDADDFRTTSENGTRHTRALPLRNGVPIRAEVRLYSGNSLAAEGAVQLPARSEWSWFLIFWRGVAPLGGCYTCIGEAGFEIDPSVAQVPGEKLWVQWGGNHVNAPPF